MAAQTVCVINRKGGVGKTSTCFHLGGSLAQLGRRVLEIDLDPQASLTQGCWGPAETERWPMPQSVAALFDDRCDPSPANLVYPVSYDENVALVPGSTALEARNTPDYHSSGAMQLAVRDFVCEVRNHYDVILIDCPPTLHLASWAAVVAADAVLVPVQPEDYGAQGISHIQAFLAQARAALNPGLRLLGYLLTMVDARTALHKTYAASLVESYGLEVFGAVLPRSSLYPEAISSRLPVSHYKPRSAPAKRVNEIAVEFLERLARSPALVATSKEAA
jgi:chromosome partitioning protein